MMLSTSLVREKTEKEEKSKNKSKEKQDRERERKTIGIPKAPGLVVLSKLTLITPHH